MADAPLLSEFVSQIRNKNIARPNLYYVKIVPPKGNAFNAENSNLVSMWCSNASTPQVSIMTNDDYVEAGTRRKYAYEYDYQNLVLQFYIDQDFDIKKFFDDWMYAIVPHHRNFNFPADYTSNSLSLFIINQEDKKTYEYKYLNIYPKTIQQIDLSYSNANQPATFSVEFVYETFYYISHKNGKIISSEPSLETESVTRRSEVENKEMEQRLKEFENSSQTDAEKSDELNWPEDEVQTNVAP
jgi:hypothetical protein